MAELTAEQIALDPFEALAEIRRLRTLLTEYGTHYSSCRWWHSEECTCGWKNRWESMLATHDPLSQPTEPTEQPVDPALGASALLEEIAAVCRRRKLSLGHEDTHGAFEVVPYDFSNEVWLLQAHVPVHEIDEEIDTRTHDQRQTKKPEPGQ